MLGLGEFLNYLTWYWIVARQSQAREFKKKRDENVLRPITATRSDEFLLRLFELQEKIDRGDTPALTYFPHLSALQVTRAAFGLTLGRKFDDDDFSNLFAGKRRPFYERVREFVTEDLYADWRNQPARIEKENRLPSYFGRYLSPEFSFIAPRFFQTLLQWNERPGVTWLAFRDLTPPEAMQFPKWQLSTFNALIAGHDRHRHIRGERQSWVQYVAADIDDLDISCYSAMAQHLIGADTSDTAPGDLLDQGAFGLPAPTRLLVLPTLLGTPSPPAPAAVRSTLLITNSTYADVAQALPEPSRDHEYAVFDQESALDFLSVQPWVWSKHAGSMRTFAVCKAADDVGRVLSCHPIAEHSVVHRYEFPRSPSLTRIIGRFGSGRSTVLVQLTARLSACMPVVLNGPLAVDDLVIVEELLRSYPSGIVVVADDVDLYHRELGPQLARLARAATASRCARHFLLAYSSLARRAAGQSCEAAQQLLNADLFTINNLSEIAFTSVSVAVRGNAQLTDETVDALRLFETTPRVVTDWVETHQRRDWSVGEHEPFIAAVQARLRRWQVAYEQLPDVSRDVLRCIAALRCLLHWSELPLVRELVADVVAFTNGHPAHESFRAFRELELDGWLRETSEGFQIDDICLLTSINDFLDMKAGLDYLGQSLIDPLVWRVVEWLPEGSRRLTAAHRDAVLGTAALLLRYCQLDPLVRRMLTDRMLTERPGVAAAHCTFVDALLELGEIENAITHIESAGKLAWEPPVTLPAILQLLDARQRELRVVESIESSEESNCTLRLQRSGLVGRIRIDPEVSPRHALLAELLERQQFVPIRDFARDGPMFLEYCLDWRRRRRLTPDEQLRAIQSVLSAVRNQRRTEPLS